MARAERDSRRRWSRTDKRIVSQAAEELAGGAEKVGDHALVVASSPHLNPEPLRLLAMTVRDKVGPGIVVLGSTSQR